MSNTLTEIAQQLKDIDKKAYLNLIMNFASHSRLSNEEITEPTNPQKQTVKLLLDNLIDNYGYWPKKEKQ